MKERPIIFSAPMVRAILDGRKTQTRRIFKFRETNQPPACPDKFDPKAVTQPCPYGAPGDRLWVRETWQFCDYDGPGGDPKTDVVFRADGETDDKRSGWKSPFHMPRWASRIALKVVSVRVERLDEISEEDAKAEGIELWDDEESNGPHWKDYGKTCVYLGSPILSYRTLWQSINGPGSWAENPWVWVVEFKRV